MIRAQQHHEHQTQKSRRQGGAAISKLKQHEQCGAGFATPMQRCLLRLPHSFNAGDGKVIDIVFIGTTRQGASEEMCLGIMLV